jgi:hypothetical protein
VTATTEGIECQQDLANAAFRIALAIAAPVLLILYAR